MTKRSPYAMPEPEEGGAYSPFDALRSKRAMVDTGLPPVVFIVVNTLAGLNIAAAAAVAISLALMIERLFRKATPINAVGGLLGTGIAVYIAVKTGKPENFFWPKVAQNAVYGVVFLVSILVKRPLLGLLAQAIYRLPSEYLKDPRVRPAYSVASMAWVVLFLGRAVIYTVLILAGKAAWLAGVVLVVGWPAFAATVFFSYRYVTWRLERSGAPDPEEFREGTPTARSAYEPSPRQH